VSLMVSAPLLAGLPSLCPRVARHLSVDTVHNTEKREREGGGSYGLREFQTKGDRVRRAQGASSVPIRSKVIRGCSKVLRIKYSMFNVESTSIVPPKIAGLQGRSLIRFGQHELHSIDIGFCQYHHECASSAVSAASSSPSAC